MASVLKIVPLGGIGEFGMNCMAVRYGDEMLILDAGMGFPEETAYGVQILVAGDGVAGIDVTAAVAAGAAYLQRQPDGVLEHPPPQRHRAWSAL